ncbi:putative leucine-rich repeat receptor-like protein kinase [Carex littledalei]|uniref:Putative leucine-rich repeat receptor-like protein kinase n=1 Tax=Carex littledalei TaxID=544730 RepID=A0A833QYZ1_9POAL|nr:putative leucine-rich repeat receptor-like protein kinase [Carex littledalei]
MEATPKRLDLWCLVLLLICAFATLVDSQQPGYINIDCGLTDPSYSDGVTKLTYVSDDQFIDTGLNVKIASKYAVKNLISQFLTVRSFSNGTRNCYTLKSLTAGSKYLVRALFMYGDYDSLNKPPIFDIHLGVNYWDTFTVSSVDDPYISEIITTATSNYLQVCLINKNQGTPFISGLELRPLPTRVYADANSTHSLVSNGRLDLGAKEYVRYPDDLFDRLWLPATSQGWKDISSRSLVQPKTDFMVPSFVMQTAVTTLSTLQPLTIPWHSNNESTVFLMILHFCEVEASTVREFYMFVNGDPVFTITPGASPLSVPLSLTGNTTYSVSLVASSRSRFPPLLNAFELYTIQPNGIPTYSGDVSAIETIKKNYRVNKGWSGDPCVPTDFSWTGVNCTSDSSKNPRITALNLSYSGLTGSIISAFGDLSALKSLDLSYNDLSGALPTSLDQLTALTYL